MSVPAITRLWILVGCLLAAGWQPAKAQEATPQEPAPSPREQAPFVFRTWKSEDGLPHNSVNTIAQTPDGYLWLGTYNGLARFDGMHCHVLGLKDGLRGLQISTLLLDSHGTLWIGTVGGGLSRLEHGHIKTLTSADGLAGDTVNTLLEDQEGTLWIGTTSGLNWWKNGALQRASVPGLADKYMGALALDQSGAVWIAVPGSRLCSFKSGNITPTAVPPNMNLVESLMVDKQNRLWVGTFDGKVYCRNSEDGSWITYGQTNGLPNSMVNKLALAADGTIWAGTLDEGVYYLSNDNFKGLREADGLSSGAINALMVDRDQYVWVGTRAGGLCRLTPRRLYNLRVLENGAERFPHSLAETADGKLWVGTAGRGLFEYDGTNFSQFLRELPISGHMFVRAVLAGHDGSLWWGAGPALYQWKTNTLARQFDGNHQPWLRGDRVTALCEDLDGGLWVGTFNGQLRHLHDKAFDPVGNFGGQPITGIVHQSDGSLWVGLLSGGLVRFQDGKQTVVTAGGGLGSELVQALFQDRDETLWVGTVGGGLGRWQKGKLDFFSTQQGLTDDNISQIVEDDANNLWLGGNRGIMRISKAELGKVASHQADLLHLQMLGWREGMLSEQCVVGFNAAIKSGTGKLFFCTSKGIVVVDPTQRINKASPPRVLLERVTVDGEDATGNFSHVTQLPPDQPEPAGNLPPVPEIAPGPQAVQFQFTGLSFDAPELIQFRYQLEGVDSSWVDAGRDRLATYAHLPPGPYTFRVIACNAQGVWNLTGASVQFQVLPFFWQRGWFTALEYAAVVFSSAALILFIVRRRYRNRLRLLEMERATGNERARIARDLHDEVGSSLTRISMMSDQIHSRLNDPEQLKVRAGKLSDFAVRTTQAFEEIVWAVNPRNDSLRSLLEYLTHFTRELFEDSGITCRFHTPNELPEVLLAPDTRHSLFLTVKEALNNVLKHSGASQVTLQMEMDPASLIITIQDDGKGFESSAPAPNAIEHDGLSNMRQRIHNLGGQFDITSETGRGRGTTVRIRLAREKLGLHKSAGQS